VIPPKTIRIWHNPRWCLYCIAFADLIMLQASSFLLEEYDQGFQILMLI
jgi:hypothetical protein